MDTDVGRHNQDLPASASRILTGGTYRDCSTVALTPSRGEPGHLGASTWTIKFALALSGLIKPMNQQFCHWPVIGHEVGEAYNVAVANILADENLSKWRYILTLEDDNLPPPDGLLKLYEAMHAHPEFDVIGGLYWTKGDLGQPMIYGDPKDMPLSFRPQPPIPNTVQECNGLGMGFTLFRMHCFKKSPAPWFKTIQEWRPNVGTALYTQDLRWFEGAKKHGMRFACHTGVLVGHYDKETGIVW